MVTCRSAGAVVLLLGVTAVAQATSIALNPASRGVYTRTSADSGYHDPSNPKYLAGLYVTGDAAEYRNFFVFDLTGFAGRIISASLVLNTLEVAGGDQTFNVYNVTTPVATLTASGSNQGATFADLGDGTLYGSRAILQSQSDPNLALNTKVEIPLSADFVSTANAMHGPMAIGGALTLTAGSSDRYVFGYADVAPMSCSQLVVQAFLPGDADGDGTVNGADLNTVLSNYNRSGATWQTGDFNGDSAVNGADLNTVLSNYNQSLGVGQVGNAGDPAAVPEPPVLLLLAIAGLTAGAWRARRPAD
jgi:hypothetical protein